MNIIDAKLIILIGIIYVVIDASSTNRLKVCSFFVVAVSIGRIHRTNAIQMIEKRKNKSAATLATNSYHFTVHIYPIQCE